MTRSIDNGSSVVLSCVKGDGHAATSDNQTDKEPWLRSLTTALNDAHGNRTVCFTRSLLINVGHVTIIFQDYYKYINFNRPLHEMGRELGKLSDGIS